MNWLRRKRFWAAAVILLYTLLGFLAAPLLIRNSIIDLFQVDLGRVVQIEKIEVNPYVLSIRVQGFEVSDTDGARLLAFDELFINFQLSSLFNWAWTFDEIKLTAPYFYFERFNSGESRIDHLLSDFAKARPADPGDLPDTEDTEAAPRLLIHALSLQNGHVDITDNVPSTPVISQLAPINISIQKLNTLPDRHGQQSVKIQLPDGASLEWSGSLTLEPLDSEGELVLKGLHLDPVTAYLKDMLPLESVGAKLSSRFHYYLRHDRQQGFQVDIDDWDVELANLEVRGLEPVTDFINIPLISLRGGEFLYPQQSLRFDQLRIENPQLTAWINQNGSISVMELMPEAAEPGSPWQLGIDEFVLVGGSLALSDKSVEPNAVVGITELRVNATEISNENDALMPIDISGHLLEGGSYTLNGSLGVLPDLSMSLTVTTRALPLMLSQPYIQQFARIVIENGVLDSDVVITMPAQKELTIGGSIRVPGLEINDALENQRLLAWETLDIDRFDMDADGLHLSQMEFGQIFGRIVVNGDGTTNLSGLMVEQQVEATDRAGGDSMSVIIGGIRITDGALDFSDLSLPLPFATHIADMDGTISTIATNSTEPANIRLEGQVDEFGLARIEGSMNMLDPIQHTDVTVEFRNLLMSNLSPYSVQFAGREITAGKMELDLVYGIEEGLLHGGNDIVLSNLELGEKVDHPDAGSLPLGLAVSLLKDANGLIEIDLPVEGDVNDPEFKIGGVIWQAVAGLITKVISAPFRLLGKLVGVDSEEFGQFEFLAGRADLTPPELEKIVQLGNALQQRPELTVEISGVTDRQIDIPALKFIRLRDTASERLGEGLSEADHDAMMLDVEIRALVEVLFIERFPDTPPGSLKAAHMVAPAGDPEAKLVFDELAYARELWDRLLESEVITDQVLTELATARAEAVKAAFLANGEVDASRIIIAEPKDVESEDGDWVKMELAVASG